jgi:hypothetical protein
MTLILYRRYPYRVGRKAGTECRRASGLSDNLLHDLYDSAGRRELGFVVDLVCGELEVAFHFETLGQEAVFL